LRKVTDEIKVYSEDEHLKKGSPFIIELYEKYKNAILNLNNGIEINPQKWYISFKKGSSIAYLELSKGTIKITINLKVGKLDDPKRLAKDVSTIGHRGYGDYQIQVKDDKHLEYIMSLIKQAIQ